MVWGRWAALDLLSGSSPGLRPLVTVTLPVPAERRYPCCLLFAAWRAPGPEYDRWAPRGRGPVAAEDVTRLRRLVLRLEDVGLADGRLAVGCSSGSCGRPPARGPHVMDAGRGWRATMYGTEVPPTRPQVHNYWQDPHVMQGYCTYFHRLQGPTGTFPTCSVKCRVE